MLGKRRVVVSSVELLNEICDEKRFGKVVTAALGEVRNLTGDGLFTAVCPPGVPSSLFHASDEIIA